MEIIEDIHRVDEASSNFAHSNVYLVIDGKEMLVIDTGTSGNAKKIVAYIQKIGRQAFEVSTIILTHYHMDHVGSAKELKDLTKAKVAAHLEDADFVAGKKSFPKPKTFSSEQFHPSSSLHPSRLTLCLRMGTELETLRLFLFQVILQEALRCLMNKEKSCFQWTP